jgi:hypothetical protein
VTGRLRRAGSGRLPDGSLVTWSVAEGARGRRWRWTVSAGEGLHHAGLVELDAGGRFVRLELETTAGLLTLHPEAGAAMAHGNVVRAGGVDPIAIEWSDDASIVIEGDPFGSALVHGPGSGWLVSADLSLRPRAQGSAGGADQVLAVDEGGIPRLLDGEEWPLET